MKSPISYLPEKWALCPLQSTPYILWLDEQFFCFPTSNSYSLALREFFT